MIKEKVAFLECRLFSS